MPASCLSLSPFAHSVAHVVAGAGSGVGFALTPHFVTSPGGHVHDHEVGARGDGIMTIQGRTAQRMETQRLCSSTPNLDADSGHTHFPSHSHGNRRRRRRASTKAQRHCDIDTSQRGMAIRCLHEAFNSRSKLCFDVVY